MEPHFRNSGNKIFFLLRLPKERNCGLPFVSLLQCLTTSLRKCSLGLTKISLSAFACFQFGRESGERGELGNEKHIALRQNLVFICFLFIFFVLSSGLYPFFQVSLSVIFVVLFFFSSSIQQPLSISPCQIFLTTGQILLLKQIFCLKKKSCNSLMEKNLQTFSHIFPFPFLPLPLLDNAFVQLLSSIQSNGRHYEGSFCFNVSHNVYLKNNKISEAMQCKEIYGWAIKCFISLFTLQSNLLTCFILTNAHNQSQ